MREKKIILTDVVLIALGILLLSLAPGEETAPHKGSHITASFAGLTISPTTAPAGQYGSAYNLALQASGGQGAVTFSVTSGVLPPGLSLSADGGLTGTPTKAGSYTFTVTASGAAKNDPAPPTPPSPPPPPSPPSPPAPPAQPTPPTPPPPGNGPGNGDGDGKGKGKGDKDKKGSSIVAAGGGTITGTQSFTLVINPAALTITANNATGTYGSALPALTASYSGFVNGDNASSLTAQAAITTTGSSSSAAGNYSITASGAASPNYNINYQNGTLTINPAVLNVAANAQTKPFGAPDPPLTYAASGFVNGDNTGIFFGALGRSPGENAGTYPINKGNLGAGGNYTINFTGNYLTITKDASQHITWTQSLLVGCNSSTTLTLTATASSGLPVSYSSSDPTIATVSGNVLTLLSPGTAVITATQAGNVNYPAAAPVNDTLIYASTSLIRQHWDDAIFFDNSDSEYVQWQWYKDGEAVTGATTPYYTENPLDGQYFVVATNRAGQDIQSCTLVIKAGGAISGGIKVSPNPIHAGAPVTVTSNYSGSALQGATLQIIDLQGKVRQKLTSVQPSMTVTMPSETGIYIVDLQLANGQNATINILVQG